MEKRQLEDNLFHAFLDTEDKEKNIVRGKYRSILDYVLNDDTLDFRFAGKSCGLYYRGLGLADISIGRIRINKAYISGMFDVENTDNMTADEFIRKIPFLKQNADYNFYKPGGSGITRTSYECEFSQLIQRENNSKNLGKTTDYFIIEAEYPLEINDGIDKDARIDLIGVRIDHDKKAMGVYKYRLAFIEVKYGDKNLNKEAGIESHFRDYQRILRADDGKRIKEFKEDLTAIFDQKRQMGLFPGTTSTAPLVFAEENEPDNKGNLLHSEFVLVLIGHNTNAGKIGKGEDLNTVLGKCYDKFEKEVTDNFFIAKTSEFGLGLYSDERYKIPVGKYIGRKEES